MNIEASAEALLKLIVYHPKVSSSRNFVEPSLIPNRNQETVFVNLISVLCTQEITSHRSIGERDKISADSMKHTSIGVVKKPRA